MTKEAKEQAREELRRWAIKWTKGCDIQEGVAKKNKPYPCGTCFVDLINSLIDKEKKEYKEHNDEIDRANEVWRFVLQMRDEKY